MTRANQFWRQQRQTRRFPAIPGLELHCDGIGRPILAAAIHRFPPGLILWVGAIHPARSGLIPAKPSHFQ